MFPLTTGYRWNLLKLPIPITSVSVINEVKTGARSNTFSWWILIQYNCASVNMTAIILSVVCSTLWIKQIRENKMQYDDSLGVLLSRSALNDCDNSLRQRAKRQNNVYPRRAEPILSLQWALWRLKSPTPPLFAQSFLQAHIKEYIKAPDHWPLKGEKHNLWLHHIAVSWSHITKKTTSRYCKVFSALKAWSLLIT